MSFIWNGITSFWYNLLSSLGLSTAHGKSGSLVVLGLDNAGKTTLLYRLRTGGDIRHFPPTDRPSIQTFTVPTGYTTSIQFNAWDLGGHEAVRHLWDDYIIQDSVTGILFIIDASDNDRLEEAAYELDSLICGSTNQIVENIPIAILFNKCDLPEAIATEELYSRLELNRLQIEHEKHNSTSLELLTWYRISVLHGTGYQDAFQWMSKFLYK